MKFLLKFLVILPAFIFSHEYLLSLGEFGSVRYTYEDEHLLQVERLSPAEEVIYIHDWDYKNSNDEEARVYIDGTYEWK